MKRFTEIACSEGGHYRLSVDEDGDLSVLSIVGEIARAGVGVLETIVSLPAGMLGYEDDSPAQQGEITQYLYSLISLSGNQCEVITAIDRRTIDDHVVTCRDGSIYRVHNGADGLVRVQRQ